MPLDVTRLMDSDLFALSTGDEFKAAVALWARSWNQVPAASLPDDDRVLAHLSGAGKRWRKVKQMALHGWILCSDGRFYHKTVAEKAREAFERRIRDRERKNKWRAEKIEKSDDVDADATRTGRGRDADVPVLSPLNGTDRTGPEQKEEILTAPSPCAAREADEADDWPAENQDGGAVLTRPPSDNRSGGARTPGDVLARFVTTSPPEKRLKRQDRADADMVRWLTTHGGFDVARAWALLMAARDDDDPGHTEAARELERISAKNRLGWFAEETA